MRELMTELEKAGWKREDDAQPKGIGENWPYFSKGKWRFLIGSIGWITMYRLDKQDLIQDQESRKLENLEECVKLLKTVK